MATPPGAEDNRTPLIPRFRPGFFTESSSRDTPQRWKTGNKVRFRGTQEGIAPEKMGGWLKRAIVGDTHTGVGRRLHEWSSLDGESWIAEGTNTKLYLINRDTRYDITPLRRNVNLTDPLSTQIGTAIVTVNDPGHSSNVGDAVRVFGATAVGGLTISGEYTITAVIDGNLYQITASGLASGSATGGGSVSLEYDINIGTVDQTVALGWGVCGYGESPWGTARSAACSGVIRKLRTWSLDNFGEDLIANPRGDAIFWWDRTAGPLSRAVLLTSAPRTNLRMLISNSGGQIVCLGAYDDVSNTPDPMFVRVGAEQSLTDFTLTDENTVFEERLATGSEIVTGVRTRAGIFISTDEAVYIMQEDSQNIFRVNKLAEGNACISPNAMLEIDGTAYYMTPYKFMRYDGVLDEIPCDVWNYVFADPTTRVHRTQTDKIYCWYNEKFGEIWWNYPSEAGGGENDRYVIFNTTLNCWYFGTIIRTAAAAPGPSYDLPVAVNPAGELFRHEVGLNDDTIAMVTDLESHDFMIGVGKYAQHITRAIPDMLRFSGNLQLRLKGKKWPQKAAYVTKGPYGITPTMEHKGVRITGRQVAIQFGSIGIDDDWRLGTWTFYTQPDAEE